MAGDAHRWLEWLCCPACRGPLAALDNGDLSCAACAFDFPVVDGIPVLFPTHVRVRMEELFGRYWDAPEKAALYDAKVEGGEDLFGVYNHRSEIHALTTLYHPAKLGAVLDAGCGNGRFFDTLPATSFKVGVDASLNLLRRVKARGRGDLLVCAELEHLPFHDGVFDTVISCRVLQHLTQQQEAVAEMARVCRPEGEVLLELYNRWNLKTLYKEIRMSRVGGLFNWPFRLLFRSMSPFEPWGLDYDRYNGWWEVKGFFRRARVATVAGRGAGFGYHKYLLQPFYLDALLARRAPAFLAAYYDRCFALEKAVGALPPFRWLWEKFVIKGVRKTEVLTVSQRLAKTWRHHYGRSAFANRAALAETAREGEGRAQENRLHLRAALDWLQRAQDAAGGQGVARGYGVGYVQQYRGRGWQPAYPETTGYLIPTLLEAGKRLGEEELVLRAMAMADWEIAVQMQCGAVMGGTVERPPSPAVFNTGQVILGWLAAYAHAGQARHLEAARRAGAWLVAGQQPDGGWRRGNSLFAAVRATTYNARVGWSLLQLARVTGEARFRAAGLKNLHHVLARQQDNGWFADNCLDDPDHPLLHTICYALEGLWGGWAESGEEAFHRAVARGVSALAERVTPEGRIPGRLDRHWRGSVPWDCLTGSAQLAGLCLAWHRAGGGAPFLATARALLAHLKTTQNLVAADAGLKGGIKGSFPFDGDYGRFEVLNWPTKFFVDALLLDESIPGGG